MTKTKQDKTLPQKQRKALLDLSNNDATSNKRKRKAQDQIQRVPGVEDKTPRITSPIESCAVCVGQSCELKEFQSFVSDLLQESQHTNNKKRGNAAYYAWSTKIKRVRGKGNQYSIPECCKQWLRKTYPSTN